MLVIYFSDSTIPYFCLIGTFAQICKIVGGQRYSRKLNEVQVRNLLRATCERPPAREGRIKNMVAANRYNDEDVVKKFGMQVKAEMAMVEARVLPPPMV